MKLLSPTNWKFKCKFRFAQDVTQLLYYKNLCKEDLWLDCADKLTAMIQNIIEFAKLIPGFMRLSQDDQVCVPRNIFKEWLSNFKIHCRFYFSRPDRLNSQSSACHVWWIFHKMRCFMVKWCYPRRHSIHQTRWRWNLLPESLRLQKVLLNWNLPKLSSPCIRV